VTYEKDRASAAGMYTLCAYRGLKPVLISDDFMLTPEFLHNTLGVNPKKVLIPEREDRKLLQQKTAEESQVVALITSEGLAPFAYAVTGARSLKTAAKLGVVIHMIGGILGIFIMLVLGFLGATWLLTPAKLFLYELIWLIPGLIITERTRTL